MDLGVAWGRSGGVAECRWLALQPAIGSAYMHAQTQGMLAPSAILSQQQGRYMAWY